MAGLSFYAQTRFAEHLSVMTTPKEDIEVVGINIVGKNSIFGTLGEYSVSYFPSNTTQKGVAWSIVQGTEYAAISGEGIVVLNDQANESTIRIRATSLHNSSVYSDFTLTATYNSSGVGKEMLAFCNRVFADRGTLLYGDNLSTQDAYIGHTELLGVAPQLDFLGYKLDDNGGLLKLYSFNQVYDCSVFTGLTVRDGRIVPLGTGGKMEWNAQFRSSGHALTKLLYDGPLNGYNSAESVFVLNLMGGIDNPTHFFYQRNYFCVEHGRSQTVSFYMEGLNKVQVEVIPDNEINTYVKSLMLNGMDAAGSQVSGIDNWNAGMTGDTAFIKIYNGFNLILGA